MKSGKIFLWSIRLNVFVAGAIVMALEIAGSRILAPYFGNSLSVWGSLIGVVSVSYTHLTLPTILLV